MKVDDSREGSLSLRASYRQVFELEGEPTKGSCQVWNVQKGIGLANDDKF